MDQHRSPILRFTYRWFSLLVWYGEKVERDPISEHEFGFFAACLVAVSASRYSTVTNNDNIAILALTTQHSWCCQLQQVVTVHVNDGREGKISLSSILNFPFFLESGTKMELPISKSSANLQKLNEYRQFEALKRAAEQLLPVAKGGNL